MKDHIVQLKDGHSSPNDKIGGKATNLIRLASMGFDVPDAFFITSGMYYNFFHRNSILELIQSQLDQLRSLDLAISTTAAKLVRDAVIRSTFSEKELDLINEAVEQLIEGNYNKNLAVRSSGNVEDGTKDSWAGQFDSFLDVNPRDVPDYIKRCWASLFGARAINYGINALLNEEIPPFAVIIQLMVTGEYSGIAFSVDPIDGNPANVLIEAVAGSGEKAVGGRDTPYSVVISKDDHLVIKRKFGSQGKVELLPPQILGRLAMEVTKIEEMFTIPVDVEWTIRDWHIYILQARPITSLNTVQPDKKHHASPDILDYELTFKVVGLNFMFADLLSHGFGYLHPLFICNKDEFWQYFPKERMEYAAKYGYRWLNSPTGFSKYHNEFTIFHKNAIAQLTNILENRLTTQSVRAFFSLIYDYFTFYSKMDFQFTNLTYLYVNDNVVIAKNLRRLSRFKDVARVWVNHVSINDDCLLSKLLCKISHQFKISRDDLGFYKIAEIIALFDTKNSPQLEDIKMRSECSIVINNGLSTKYMWGEHAAHFISHVEKIRQSRENATIAGQVANRGANRYVTGTVCLINVDYSNLQEMEKSILHMKKGHILVSEFTAPELIMACSKALAIVTDMGGMLSHAAIVSRELGIPCVVGTEHASRSLTNGESINIDLDLGIIEKL